MSVEHSIRLSDGYHEIRRDGVLVAEVHPTDARSCASANFVGHILSLADQGCLPTYMRPRTSDSATGGL